MFATITINKSGTMPGIFCIVIIQHIRKCWNSEWSFKIMTCVVGWRHVRPALTPQPWSQAIPYALQNVSTIHQPTIQVNHFTTKCTLVFSIDCTMWYRKLQRSGLGNTGYLAFLLMIIYTVKVTIFTNDSFCYKWCYK